jgi:hypothetical protein
MIYECPNCQTEETFPVSSATSQNLKCQVCGSTLTRKLSPPSASISNTPQLSSILPLLSNFNNPLSTNGSDFSYPNLESVIPLFLAQLNPDILADRVDPSFLNLFREAVEGESLTNKQLNQKHLDEIGILTVDSRKVVLLDSAICIGPLTTPLILADFSYLPGENTNIDASLTLGSPIYGETPSDIIAFSENMSVLLDRGKVTFAQKYRSYSSTNLSCLIISQTNNYKFPFMMTDSSKELVATDAEFVANNHQAKFPVGMISERDATVIKKLLETTKSKSADGRSVLSIKIKFGCQEKECSICMCQYESCQEIYKLSCRHIYHKECLSRWVNTRASCPLCRLPIERAEKTQKQNSNHRNNDLPNNFYT